MKWGCHVSLCVLQFLGYRYYFCINCIYNKILGCDWLSAGLIGMPSCGQPITVFQFELYVIGYPCNMYVNYTCFYGFIMCFQHLSKLMKSATDFLPERSSQKTCKIPGKITMNSH